LAAIPTVLLEDEVQVPGFLLLRNLVLDLFAVKVLEDAIYEVLLRLQPVVQSLLARGLKTSGKRKEEMKVVCCSNRNGL
jgi:hypothetical protein